MSPTQPDEDPGRPGPDTPGKIASYRIEKRLGAGGMGVVYRAFDEVLQRPLALKHLRPGQTHPTAAQRFRREAQAAARLNHPAIVRIYDIVATETGDWIAMELVEGASLAQKIREGSLDLRQAVRLGREIAEGLAEAHARGVIHRDLKAGNVMVTASGHAKILDFGLAKLIQPDGETDLSVPGKILGTYHAMSPEQLQGLPLDPRSDLFSLGSLLYEMLTGVSPFRGGTVPETLARICTFQPPAVCRVRPEVPQDLSDLVAWLLGKDPDQRPAGAGEVVRYLEAIEVAVRPADPAGDDSDLKKSTIAGVPAVQRPASRSISGSHPASERRQVTVVCCELMHTDGLSDPPQEPDPETLHELMLRLRGLAEAVTQRYDGHLGSLLGGHRMLICFGYPQAHEDNARRAVRAALELVEQAARLSPDEGMPVALTLRAGIHTGQAVVVVPPQGQEPVTLGATLDLAVELLSRAEPGQVLVSSATCSLVEKSFALEALPPVEAPGLGVPLRPYRVLEPVDVPGDSSAGLLPLVGREREMELLLSRWDLAREGHGQAVLISGEAGIGKSRLVLALRDRLEPGTAQWSSCFGSPYAQSSPLQPLLGLLRQVLLQGDAGSPLDRLADSLRDAGLADAVPLFAPLLDLSLDGRYPPLNLPAERKKEKTLEALTSLVLEAAERQPLVLVIEDLHWLDPTTLSWLDQLIGQVASAPVLLLMTLRLQAVESLWGPRSHLTQITLGPLSAAEAEALLDRVAGEEPLPAAVRRQIVARTDGVPLFLEELTKAVLESPAGGEQELPATLRDSLAARLDRLGTAKQVAQVASVIGRTFTLELLAAVCSLDEVMLQGELRRLVQAELIYRKGAGGRARYLFKHALVQDAAYESLLKRERQQIHRQIVEALETRFPETAETTPELLAHHCTEAGLTGPAIDFWVRAGAVAGRRSATAEALNHLNQALRLLQSLAEGPERDHRELKIQNARAAALITRRGYTDPDVEQAYARAAVLAERLAAAEEHFWAVLGLQTFHATSGNLPQALHLAESLLRIAESEPAPRPNLLSIAWFALGSYHYFRADYHEAATALEKSFDLAPPDDDSYRIRTGADLRVAALSFGSLAFGHLGRYDRALQQRDQSLAIARQLGSPFSLAFACVFKGLLSYFMGDLEALRHEVREAYNLAVELGLSNWIWQTSFLLAWSEQYAPEEGAPTIDLGDDDSVRQLLAQKGGGATSLYVGVYAEILIRQRRPGEAWRVLEEGWHLVLKHGGPGRTGELYRLQGEILRSGYSPPGSREDGGRAEAERLFQKALEVARHNGSKSTELRAALSLGRFWESLGRTQEAREVVAQACRGVTGDSPILREAQAFLETGTAAAAALRSAGEPDPAR